MWEVENRSPFLHRAGFLRDHAGRTLWCLHLKASFVLRPEHGLQFTLPQTPLLQAPLYEDTRLLADAEIGQARPLCDLILSGQATAPPDARPELGWRLQARLGTWRKTLQVRPAQVWKNGRPVAVAAPLASVPLDWRAAYGGPEFAANPLGLGHLRREGGRLPRLAPEGVAPDTWAFDPASFGPIAREWPQRAVWGGRYDEAWLRRRAPLLPQDLDPRYWQVSPQDQWIDPENLPGATLELTGFCAHPLSVTLPDCTFEIATRMGGKWYQQTPRLQSVGFDLDSQRLTMLWLADLPVGATQNDVLVERSFIALHKSRGFKVSAADLPAFMTQPETV